MNRTPRLFLLAFYLILAGSFTLKGQTILQQKTCKDMHSGFPHYKWLNQDPSGGYIFAMEKDETNSEGLYLDDVLIPTFHHAEDNPSFINDFFICKLNSDFSLQKSFVIDNAELGRDVYCGEDYVLYSMSIPETQANTDSFPILLNGEVQIPREGNEGTGVVVVLNKQLELVNYFFPSTGEIGQVAVDGHMAYLELRIPSEQAYIIVNGTDTVYNQRFQPPISIYGLQTVVLCKYNLLSGQVEWLLRIGDVGFEELIEMHIDHEHNLVVLGSTNSTYFSFHDTDTVMNNSDHNPFIAKYSPDGEFLLGIINQNEVNEFATELIIDSSNNYFIRSLYYGDYYKLEDTTLINPKFNNRSPARGFFRKYNGLGKFQWAWQLPGDFEGCSLFSIIPRNDDIVVSGTFEEGALYLAQDTFLHSITGDLENEFLILVDKEDASLKNYFMTQGLYHRGFYNLQIDDDGNLDMFMRFRGHDSIFQKPFETPPYSYYGYLLKLSLSPLSNVEISGGSSLFSIRPNPATNAGIYLSLLDNIFSQRMTYTIFDGQGHSLERKSISPDKEQFIATSDWPPGPYWIQVQSGNHVQGQLIIIQ